MINHIVIQPANHFPQINLKELWQYRELFFIFAWRDIKVRYKQTVLGIAWAVLQPITSTFIFTIFFGRLAKIPSGDLPYSLFVLCGLVFWNLFSQSLSHASNSLIENENIVKKVYFPRLILPLSSVVTSLIDFVINLILLLLFAAILGFLPSLTFFPILLLGLIIVCVGAGGLGLFLSAFNVRYRDVRYILPFFIQTMLFLTPVIYPTTIVRDSNKYLMGLNPVSGVIEAIRSTFSASPIIDWQLLAISAVSAIICFLLGLYYFRRTEAFFADIV